MPSDSQRHNSYTESVGTTIEFNHYGQLCSGCSGNNNKDRSADTVIRYNWIESANMQLDLIDGSAQTPVNSHYQNDTKVGGPNHYWEDAEGRLIWSGNLSDTEKNFRGTYSMQIQSTTNQSHDTFLNVMQFGDADTLSAMAPVSRIDAGTMVGAFIDDPTTTRVVLFSSDSQGAPVTSATYAIGGTASSEIHLLLEMAPGSYDVYKDNLLIHSGLSVSSNGVLAFDSAGGTSYQIVKQ